MSEALIKAAQKGDQDAFLDLIKQHDRQVMSVVYRFTACFSEREDMYQDIFLHIFQSIKKFKFKASFNSWLYRVAMNRSLSYIRRNKPAQVFDELPASNGVDFEQRAKLSAVHKALAALKGQQRICFHLFYVEDWSVEEIADVLDCKQGTVKAHLQRARLKIKSAREVRTWLANPI